MCILRPHKILSITPFEQAIALLSQSHNSVRLIPYRDFLQRYTNSASHPIGSYRNSRPQKSTFSLCQMSVSFSAHGSTLSVSVSLREGDRESIRPRLWLPKPLSVRWRVSHKELTNRNAGRGSESKNDESSPEETTKVLPANVKLKMSKLNIRRGNASAHPQLVSSLDSTIS